MNGSESAVSCFCQKFLKQCTPAKGYCILYLFFMIFAEVLCLAVLVGIRSVNILGVLNHTSNS